jgi:hypothetical protein
MKPQRNQYKMKLLFSSLMLLTFCGQAFSQFSAGMHTGTSQKKLLAGFQAQYQFQNGFTAGINMTTFANPSSPAFFQTRLGYALGNTRDGFSALPYAGYSYGIQNAEKNNFGSHFTTGVQLRYQVTPVAMIYSDVNVPAPKMYLFSIGLAGRLPLRYECR